MKPSQEVKKRFKNPAHQGAFLKGRRAAVLKGKDAVNPYEPCHTDEELAVRNNGNRRNGNTFSMGLRNAWQAGFDEQVAEMKESFQYMKDQLDGSATNNLAEAI